ncbi:hypothetical protein LguiA_015913 [Lonicera macranthoides]
MLENHMGKSIPCVLGGMVLPPTFPSIGKVFPEFVLTKQRKGTTFLSRVLKSVNQTKPKGKRF